MAGKTTVFVLLGGRSGEHDVSLMSAESVMKALNPERYDVVPVGISKSGKWILDENPLAALKNLDVDPTILTSMLPDPIQKGLVAGHSAARSIAQGTDRFVVFPVLHGPLGEDGTVQGLLELADVPYVGDGVAASAVGMDKALMKDVFKARSFPMVAHRVFLRRQIETAPADVVREIEEGLGYPCFVKPANLGSSVGISKVHNREELPEALELACQFDRKVVVEEEAKGCREIEVSVLGNDDPIASVAGEIVPCREFYDYNAKYIEDRSELVIPARIGAETMKQVQAMAVEAFRAVDGSGLARVDFFVHKESDQIYLNEINTMPGFTRISMYPKLWDASGITYPELLDRLIELAFERYEDKHRSLTSSDRI